MTSSGGPYGWCGAFVIVASFAAFSPSLLGEFVFDDLPAIRDNPDVYSSASNWSQIWGHDFWGEDITLDTSHKSFRPLATSTFRLIASSPPSLRPFLHHLVNLLLHCANVCLTLAISKRLLGSKKEALQCATLFGLHPVHCESVAGGVGLADMACAVTCLLAVFMWLRAVIPSGTRLTSSSAVWLTMVLSTVAVLYKEQGIMTVPIVLALDFLYNHKATFVRKKFLQMKHPRLFAAKAVLCATYLAVILYLRLRVMNFKEPKFQKLDNPAAFMEPTGLKALNFHYHYTLNSWLLLCPNWLCFDWAMGCLPLISSVSDCRIICVVLWWITFFSLIVYCLHSRHGRHVTAAMIFLVFPFIPASNIFFIVGFVIAERNLYLSVFGYSLLVVIGMGRISSSLPSTRRRPLSLAFVLLSTTFFAKCFLRATDWQTEMKLFTSGLTVCPNNAKVHYNIAKRASEYNNYDLAVSEYLLAIKLHPDYEQALNNLGNIYKNSNRLEEAKSLLRQAVRTKPRFAAAWMNLGIVEASLGDFVSAERSYMQSLKHRRHCPDCYFNLGNLYLKTADNRHALAAFEAAIAQKPTHKSAWLNLIILADEIDDHKTAWAKSMEAIQLFPREAEFYFHLGNMQGKAGKFEDAEASYLQALAIKETSLYYNNLGVLYHRWKKYREAESSYTKAIQMDPSNKGAAFNLERVKM